MSAETKTRFFSDPLKPVVATCDTGAMAQGAPGMPREFVWRGKTLTIASVVRTWRETGPCTHGSAEVYVRKHWFEVSTSTGQMAKIYFERRPRSRAVTQRWWLFSMDAEK